MAAYLYQRMMRDQFIGEILAEKYRVESVMRESGMGRLYRGTHLLMDKPVAIKILSPALAVDENIVQKFSVEARTLSRLSHPNVLNVTDYGSDRNGTVFIVMEHADGIILKDAVRAEGRFSLERAIRVAQQVASALSTAHAQGVIHRNLSSENILLTATPTETDVVKVLDFGTVKMDGAGILDEEFLIGRPEYFSPEQCSESSEADERSDVYSLGIIAYEMLTGELPFIGEKQTDVMMKHVQEPPPPILALRQDLPVETETVIQRALAKQPVQRFQSATDFSDALRRLASPVYQEVEQETVVRPKSAEIPGLPEGVSVMPQPQNNIWKTAFIVLAGISVLSAGLIYMTYSQRTNPSTEMMADPNGLPTQPLNPATGASEDLSNVNSMMPDIYSNSNMAIPGGDNYDPWARGGVPPAGAPPSGSYPGGSVPYPVPAQPGGQIITIDPGNSQFMPPDTQTVIVPANSNVAVKPGSNVKVSNSNAKANVSVKPPTNTNTGVAKPPKPAANTGGEPGGGDPKTDRKPAAPKPPAAKPAEEKPADKPPSSSGKKEISGKERDS